MTRPPDPRITPHHRCREAIVYVRQSTAGQVRTNQESTQVQLGLRDRAIALGWPSPLVIDDDLGVSAGGFAERPGFQRMLSCVALRQVGIILCADASRLSRNSRDWAHLFELAGFFHTLIADLDQVYDLCLPNDRLVLGIKGTVSEMELSILKVRLKMGLESKAARGELKFNIPPGYAHDPAGRIVLDPDRRVREALTQMFDQFDRSSSMRQLALWYRDTRTLFPIRKLEKSRTLHWQVPTFSTLHKLLDHPIYAGAYTYGRGEVRIEYVDGKLVKRARERLPYHKARVCIHDHHPAYISWDRFLANQAKIAESRPRWPMLQNRGAVRDGLALLAGLMRCGHCATKLYVAYKAQAALYYCEYGQTKGEKRCISFGSKLIDRRVSDELCRALAPLAIDAACLAGDQHHRQQHQAIEQARLALQAAEYEVQRAFEQFDLVDPKNRLVADTLEERLNQKLTERQTAQQRLDRTLDLDEPLTEAHRERLRELARDFPRLWNHPKADATLKKRILRTAIHEIVVTHEPDRQRLNVVIHWQGGVHTRIYVDKRATPRGSKADPCLIDMVRPLAQRLGDADIARILNMKRLPSPQGLRWTSDRVRDFRRHHHIRATQPPADPDRLTGSQAARYLGISHNGLIGLVRIGAVHKQQITNFAPWTISRAELDSHTVQDLVKSLKLRGRLPRVADRPEDQIPLFGPTHVQGNKQQP